MYVYPHGLLSFLAEWDNGLQKHAKTLGPVFLNIFLSPPIWVFPSLQITCTPDLPLQPATASNLSSLFHWSSPILSSVSHPLLILPAHFFKFQNVFPSLSCTGFVFIFPIVAPLPPFKSFSIFIRLFHKMIICSSHNLWHFWVHWLYFSLAHVTMSSDFFLYWMLNLVHVTLLSF